MTDRVAIRAALHALTHVGAHTALLSRELLRQEPDKATVREELRLLKNSLSVVMLELEGKAL